MTSEHARSALSRQKAILEAFIVLEKLLMELPLSAAKDMAFKLLSRALDCAMKAAVVKPKPKSPH